MIVIAAALIGMVSGVMTARRRGGRGADMAQYGAGFGIAFALAGLFLTIALEWLL
jgi:hypothetical protein